MASTLVLLLKGALSFSLYGRSLSASCQAARHRCFVCILRAVGSSNGIMLHRWHECKSSAANRFCIACVGVRRGVLAAWGRQGAGEGVPDGKATPP